MTVAVYEAFVRTADVDAAAFAGDVSPDLVRRWLATAPPLPRVGPRVENAGAVRLLTAPQVVQLREKFRARGAAKTRPWFAATAREFGCGHAAVRKAVYGF